MEIHDYEVVYNPKKNYITYHFSDCSVVWQNQNKTDYSCYLNIHKNQEADLLIYQLPKQKTSDLSENIDNLLKQNYILCFRKIPQKLQSLITTHSNFSLTLLGLKKDTVASYLEIVKINTNQK